MQTDLKNALAATDAAEVRTTEHATWWRTPEGKAPPPDHFIELRNDGWLGFDPDEGRLHVVNGGDGEVYLRRGLTVAFLGSDGAGKSTMSAEALAWLTGTVDSEAIYFGSGDGASSLLRAPFLLARKSVDKRLPSDSAKKRRSGLRGVLRKLAFVPWSLSLAQEKRAKLRRMTRGRARGAVVICDRFPQVQFPGFNDGPLLKGSGPIAAWEHAAYRAAERTPPDLVIRLVPSVAVALERKPDMTEAEIVERIAAVRALPFPEGVTVVEVDADQPFDTVVLEIRRAIWARMAR